MLVSDHQYQDKPQYDEAPSALVKSQKTPLAEIQKAAQGLQSCIPHHESCQGDLKEYYQGILHGGQTLQTVAVKCEVKLDQVEKDLGGVLHIFKALYSKLQDYKSGRYQKKFDMNEYKVEMKKIGDYTASLKTVVNDLVEIQQILETIKFEGDPLRHLGQEFSQEIFEGYVQVSETEAKSFNRYEEASAKLTSVEKKLQDKELKLKESDKKKRELSDSIEKARQRIKEMDTLIQEKEASILNCAEQSEQLKISCNNEYASELANAKSRDEEQKARMTELRNKRHEEIEETLSNLSRQLSQPAVINPLVHTILVLDQSGSMKGSRWNELIKAVEIFVQLNKSQTSDLLSVITFDHTATEVMKKIKFSEYQTPSTSKWRGTDFDAALTMTRDICNLSRTHRPIVVFLTDGDGAMQETHKILREMSSSHKDKGFMFFSVGVGDHFNVETLKTITRTANGGNLYFDLGNDRIDFLQTTQDEKVLAKIFTNISNVLSTFSFKVKTAIETLKKEKIESDEEVKRTYEFSTSMSEQELQDISKRQQDLLGRRIKVLEEKKEEEKSQIEFFKKEMKEISQEIDILEEKLKDVSRLVAPAEIDALKEERTKLEDEKNKAWDERQRISGDRSKILGQLEKSKGERNMSTSMQLFDFIKVKERAKFLKDSQQIYLGKMKNFIMSIIQENSYVEEELKNTTVELSNLEEDGILDIVFEQYKDVVSIEKHQDAVNFRKIACYILRIDSTDSEELKAIELLTNCLHAKAFVSPALGDEDRKIIICNSLDNKYKFDLKLLDNEFKDFDEDLEGTTKKLDTAEENVKKVKKEVEARREEKLKREKEVQTLMKKTNVSKIIDVPDQENAQRTTETEGNDKNDEDELQVAKKKLLEVEKKIEEKESREASLEKDIEYLENQQKELKYKMWQVKKKKTTIEREKEDMKEKILNYHSCLKVELMRRVNRFVKETNFEKIKVFEKSLMDDLITPILHFMGKNSQQML
jgi:uncharacterized protein YegL